LRTISGKSATNDELRPTDLRTIEIHAHDFAPAQPSLESRLDQVQAQLEYLAEEVGQENKFRAELSEYVKDLRAEAKFAKTARVVFGCIATLVGLVLLTLPIILIFKSPAAFMALPPYPKAAFLIGLIAGGVLLIQGLAKAVYRPASERHSDEFIPPQVKAIHDLIKGGGS
jgi:hypothetical protein